MIHKITKKNRENGFTITVGTGTLIVLGLSALGTAVGVYFVGKWGITQFYIDLIVAILTFINGLATSLLSASGDFLMYVLGPQFTAQTLTGDSNFVLMWGNVRDLTNMLIILAFVFIGIATTLRLREYEAKKLLPSLIMVALLINFSGLMCQTIYGTANTVQNAFLKNGGAGGVQILVSNLKQAINTLPTGIGDKKEVIVDNLGIAIATFLIILFGSVIFLLLGILLAARYAILVVFYIISPLAMFCFVFGFTKKFWSQWWEQFLQWNFIGVVTGFLIYLAATSIPTTGDIIASRYFVSFIFLFMAYRFAKKGSAIGSGAILGLAAASAGFALGAVGKVATTAGKSLANSRMGQAVGNRVGKGMEYMGIRSEGTTAQGTQKQRDDVARNVGNLSEESKTQIVQGKRAFGWTREGTDKYEAAVRDKVKTKRLSDIGDTAAQHKAIAQVESMEKSRGGNSTIRKDAVDANYQLAGFDDKKIQKYRDSNPGVSEDQAREAIIRAELREQLPKMSGSALKSINPEHLSGDEGRQFIQDEFTPSMMRKLQVAEPELKSLVRAQVMTPEFKNAINTAPNQKEKQRLMSLKTNAKKYLT